MSLIEQANELLAKVSAFDFSGLGEMLADDVVMELPYAPDPVPTRTEGRENVVAALSVAEQMFDVFSLAPYEAYESPDQNTAILEATAMGKRKDGSIYQNRYAFVFTFKDGKVVRWLEFFNPNLLG